MSLIILADVLIGIAFMKLKFGYIAFAAAISSMMMYDFIDDIHNNEYCIQDCFILFLAFPI